MNILVTGAGSVLGQSIIKSLISIKNNGENINIISLDPNPMSVGLFWSDKRYIIPMAKDPKYIEELIKVIKIEKPILIFVGTDTELPILSRHKELFYQHYQTRVIISETKIIDIANDKWLTYKFLKENKFDYPKSTINISPKEIEKKLVYPFIAKPRVGARSYGVEVINNKNELMNILNKNEKYIFQEYLDSKIEYTAGVIYFNKDNCSSIVMERTLKDGNTFIAKPVKYSWINKYLERIAERLKVFGPVNFQFKVQNNELKIFEINSRFSGTTYFRHLSGFNEVEMCIDYLTKEKKISQPIVEENKSILRYYDEIVVNEK